MGPKCRATGPKILGNCCYPLKYQINGYPTLYVLADLDYLQYLDSAGVTVSHALIIRF